MKAVECAPHEFAAEFLYAKHGLKPFFGSDAIVKQHDGSTGFIDFELDGERWQARLRVQESGIVNPGPTTPAGTEFDLGNVREYRLRIRRHPKEDEIGKQRFDAHIRPRWPDQKAEKNDGSRVTIWSGPAAEEVGDAVSVRVSGANIRFERYHQLMEYGARAVGLSSYYFELQTDEKGELSNPHPYSHPQDGEMYVRIHTDESGPVHGRTGPLSRMGHLLEDDRTGYRKVVQDDDDDHGRNLPGYYHTVTLDQRRVREMFPNHDAPKEIKHYYAREALSFSKDEPLRHPKLGASLQRSLLDDNPFGVSPDELRRLEDELTETVRATLLDAGIDVSPNGNGAFVPDAYFQPTLEEDADVLSLDLDTLERKQESVVLKYLSDGGFSPVEEDAVRTLLADGGEVSPKKIADKTGRHVGSVRRALRRIDSLLERQYGRISVRSTYVAGMLETALDEAAEAVETAMKAAASTTRAIERGVDDGTSAFIAWAETHGVDWRGGSTRDAKMKLRFGDVGSIDTVCRKARQGLERWTNAGRERTEYLNAEVEATKRGTHRTYQMSQLLKARNRT